MKKIVLLSAVLCMLSVTSVYAQKQGNMYISGSINMSGSNTATITGNFSQKQPGGFQLGITPQFGIFIIDNLDVHLGLSYEFIKQPATSGTYSTNTSLFSIMPGVTYYLQIAGSNFYYTPGLDLAVGFGGVNSKSESTKTKVANVTAFSISLSLLAFEFQPVDKIGIIFQAGDLTYALDHLKDTGASGSVVNTNTFNFGINLSTTLGFKYYF